MEKACNTNNNNNSTKLSKMLQKAMSIGHSTTPFSPARDFHHYRTTSTARRSFFFSSPITPLIPAAARGRRRIKNDVVFAEPTSPKVSCIGQIKHSKSKCPEKKNRAAPKNLKTGWSLLSSSLVKEEDKKGSFTKLKRLFSVRKSNSTPFAAAAEHSPAAEVGAASLGKMKKFASTREALTTAEPPVAAVEVPSLGKMKQFASSREALGGFDWNLEMKREDSVEADGVGHYSNDEDVTIPCSLRIPLSEAEGLGMCRKQNSEVNLWKRRSMDRPKPLQVKATY